MKKNIFYTITIWLLVFNLSAQDNFVKEWDELGKKIEIALNLKDGSFNKYFNESSFANKIIIQNPTNEDIQKLNRDMLKTFLNFNMAKVLANYSANASYSYIACKKDSSLLVRQWDTESAEFNYFFMKVDKIGNYWLVVDLYSVIAAEYMSSLMKANIYMPAVLKLLDSKLGNKKYSNFETFLEANDLAKKEEYALAYSKISEIPLQERNKMHQMFKINMSSFLPLDDRYPLSITEYEELFPNDPSLKLVLLDQYILNGEFEKIFDVLDFIKDFAMNDNFIYYYESLVYMSFGDYANAEKLIKKSIQNDGEEVVYQWKLVEILQGIYKFEECIKAIDKIKKKFSYSQNDIDKIVEESYNALYQSDIYKKWLKKQ